MAVKVCCIADCDRAFSSSHKGKNYCNKHWQSMYRYGTPFGKPKTGNGYEIKGDYVEFTDSNGETYLVDLEDLELVKNYKWSKNAQGYYVRNHKQSKIIRLHRVVMGMVDKDGSIVIDHINGDRSDNRKSNLRKTTQKNNSRNASLAKNNTTGYTGVSMTPAGRYRARIMVDRKEISLGHYDDFEDAKRARVIAEKKYFGKYAPSKGASKHLV